MDHEIISNKCKIFNEHFRKHYVKLKYIDSYFNTFTYKSSIEFLKQRCDEKYSYSLFLYKVIEYECKYLIELLKTFEQQKCSYISSYPKYNELLVFEYYTKPINVLKKRLEYISDPRLLTKLLSEDEEEYVYETEEDIRIQNEIKV